MRSQEGFEAISDMAKMGLMPQAAKSEEPKVYESVSGTRTEDRVVPPGYVSLNALVEQIDSMERDHSFAAAELVAETDDPREVSAMAAIREARRPDRLFMPGNQVHHVDMSEGVTYSF